MFVEKPSTSLLIVGDLARHFRNAKFLFMVRNPYAVCEGICRVRSDYHEMLTDMNARQIARLDAGQIQAINLELQKHRAVLNHFGYEIVDPGH